MQQYTKDQVGVNVTEAQLVELLNDQQRGGFAYVHSYVNESGEVANHWFKSACLYPNMVAKSVFLIDSGTVKDKITAEGLEVTRGTWVDQTGTQHNRKAEGRVHQIIKKTYSMANEDDRAKVLLCLAEVRQGLVVPKKVDQGFTSIAKGTYSKEDEPEGVIYFRDCMNVAKVVTKQGEYKQTASDEIPAMKEAIKRLLPVGKYRAYKLCANFDYISIGGQAILQGSNLGDWDMSLALPEYVKTEVESVLVEVNKET